jgi:hypothetical protein
MTHPTLTYASWRALHAGCIGGGLAPAVAGEGKSPLEAYARLTGAMPEEDLSDLEHIQLALDFEPIVIRRGAARMNVTVLDAQEAAALLDNVHTEVLGIHGSQVFARLRKHPQLVCTYDAIARDEQGRIGYLEAKCSRQSRTVEWKAEDGCPPAYKIQVAHGLLVAPVLELGMVACVIQGFTMRTADWPRDEDLCEALLAMELDMLKRVREGREPRVRSGDESEQRALRVLHPADNGKYVDLPAEAIETHEQLVKAQAWMAEAKLRVDKAKARLKQMIGDNSYGVLLGGRGMYTLTTTEKPGYPYPPTKYRKLHFMEGKDQ